MLRQNTTECLGTEPVSTLLEKRYELKYRISESTAHIVRSLIINHLDQDKYAARQPSGQYPISSLYLDSERFDLFHETILDKCNRFKLRIRGYDDNPESPVFFEIKRKLNRIIYKSRAKVRKNQMTDILNGCEIPLDMPEKDRMALKQFRHYSQCLMARPMTLVRYVRQAYENQSDSRVRVTFDRQLCYQYVKEPIFAVQGPGWRPLPIDFVVLEIKFTSSFPSWLKDITHLLNLERQSFSKYCCSVRQQVPRGTEYYPIPRR